MNKKKKRLFFRKKNQLLKIKSIQIAIYWHHYYQTFSSNQLSINEENKCERLTILRTWWSIIG